MCETMLNLDWKVAETIEKHPAGPAIFTRFRMACVGCAMAPFETLAEAAAAYGIEPARLLRALGCDSKEKGDLSSRKERP